jgi:hypothetical protein
MEYMQNTHIRLSKRFAIILSYALTCFVLSEAKAQVSKNSFPAKDLMTIGTYYYPEHWPKENWERDIKKKGRLLIIASPVSHFQLSHQAL